MKANHFRTPRPKWPPKSEGTEPTHRTGAEMRPTGPRNRLGKVEGRGRRQSSVWREIWPRGGHHILAPEPPPDNYAATSAAGTGDAALMMTDALFAAACSDLTDKWA